MTLHNVTAAAEEMILHNDTAAAEEMILHDITAAAEEMILYNVTAAAQISHNQKETMSYSFTSLLILKPLHNLRKMFSPATRESIEKSVTFYEANLVRALILVTTLPSTLEKKAQLSHNQIETMSYPLTLLLI